MDEMMQQALDITRAQAGVRMMSEEQISEFLKNVLRNIAAIAAENGELRDDEIVPVEDSKKSIREKSITCLVCGKKFKVITKRHLEQHSLTTAEYRKRFGLKKNVALVCKELMRIRKDKMREMRLWEKRGISSKKKVD